MRCFIQITAQAIVNEKEMTTNENKKAIMNTDESLEIS